jgi:hypothetical protein
MKYIEKTNTETIKILDINFCINYYKDADASLLTEANPKGITLIGPYSVIKHPPHNSTGDYHLHVYEKNNELFAINKNGTAHDGSHGVTIPLKVFNAITTQRPDWIIPQNRIIETKDNIVIYNSLEDLLEDTVRKLVCEYFNKYKIKSGTNF